MLLEIVSVLVAILLFCICWEFEYKWKYRSILSRYPGPTVYPLIGNALEFGLNTVDKYNDLQRLVDIYGSIAFPLRIGLDKQYLALVHPELIEYFISSTKFITKNVDYNFLRPWIGNGLLTSTGSYWQKRRKIITPTFHFKILNDFIPILNKGSTTLVKRLANEVGNEVCDVYPYATTYALDNICETAMGTSINAQINTEHEYVIAVNKICKIIMDRGFSPWKQYDFLFRLSSSYKEQQKCLNIIHGFTNKVIKKKRKELLLNSNEKTTNEVDVGEKKKIALLDLLLQSTIDGKPLTDAEISEEVNTFMFEGHDTTASAIAFALYELARHPDVQEEAVKELQEIFGDDKEREPTISDLNNMKYMELIIKETLRLYPSVPVYARELTEDVFRDDVKYPKGLHILFLAGNMHRRADIFKNPTKFDPNRFLAENLEIHNPYSYIPFSAGPRNCIGQKFALYELKSSISKVLRYYVLSPAPSKYDICLALDIILKSENGMNLRLEKRSN